jgi:site-specific DNA-methyltransferase (adenine-specific)
MTREEWNQLFAAHWNFPGVRQDGHLAMFPEELPRRLIKMFSFVGETVFDPFLGSGTTALAAKNLGRNSVGYEINPVFIPIIKEKSGAGDLLAGDECRYEFRRDDAPFDAAARLQTLPYLFHDPHRLDKKVDVRKLNFGSKIAGDDTARPELFTVKEIVAPELVRLNNGLVVRLIGIARKPGHEREAMNFLTAKTGQRRVFMKFDAQKYDAENRLLVYLYLDNKTFVNAHLLRSGLVAPDLTGDYRYKQKFREQAYG